MCGFARRKPLGGWWTTSLEVGDEELLRSGARFEPEKTECFSAGELSMSTYSGNGIIEEGV